VTLKLVSIIAHGVGNHPINFGVSRTFHSRLIGQHLSDALRDLDLWGHGTCQWYGSSCSICVPSLNFAGFPVGRYCAFTVSALTGLVTLTFWPLYRFTGYSYRVTSILPILGFLCLSILELDWGTPQTDRQTAFYNVLFPTVRGHNKPYTLITSDTAKMQTLVGIAMISK